MNIKILLQDADVYLTPLKDAQDPQTMLIRRLVEALRVMKSLTGSRDYGEQ